MINSTLLEHMKLPFTSKVGALGERLGI